MNKEVRGVSTIGLLAVVVALLAGCLANSLLQDVKESVHAAKFSDPVIDSFTLGASATSDGTVNFTLSSTHAGTGAAAITAWLVNESPTTPSPADVGWKAFTSPQSGTYVLANPGSYGTRTLYAWLKNSNNLVSRAATQRVQYSPYGAPSIDTFSLTSGTATDNPAISFNLSTASYGTGSTSITGWLVNESAAFPSATDPGWVATAPTGYTLTNLTTGSHTVYAWAKNEHNLVSGTKSLSVTINTPSGTWATPYQDGCTITAHEQLQWTCTSGPALQSTGITSNGTAGTGQGTLNGATITVAPTSGKWAIGSSKTVTVSASTTYGVPFTVPTLTVGTVFAGTCVTNSTRANDTTNDGSVRLPFVTVKKAADTAASLYGATSNTVLVARSGTAYPIDGRSATNRVSLSNATSLRGEYSDYFQSRYSINSPPGTTLTDSNASADSSTGTNPNRIIDFASGTGSSTILDGFTVTGGTGNVTTAIYCKDVSPTITNMTIRCGGDGVGTTQREGVWIEGAASPGVSANTFNDSPNGGGSTIGETDAIFINSITGTPTISGNIICSGTAKTGGGSITGVIIQSGSSTSPVMIVKNTFLPGYGTTVTGFYHATGTAKVVFANNLVEAGSTYSSATSQGVFVLGAGSNVAVRNNSIILGYPNDCSTEYGIHLQSSGSPTFYADNNIFHYVNVISNVYGVYDTGGTWAPASFKNNLFSEFIANSLVLYHKGASNDWKTISAMQTGLGASATGNASADPIGFVSTSDFHLSSSNTQGLNGIDNSWGFSDDRDGIPRPGSGTNWSVGCYQHN